jgi:hypothetical protein
MLKDDLRTALKQKEFGAARLNRINIQTKLFTSVSKYMSSVILKGVSQNEIL